MGTDKKKAKKFVELAKPNEQGISDPIDVTNLSGEYEDLNVTNGSSYSRKKSQLQAEFYLKKVYEFGEINTKTNTDDNAGVGLGKLKTIQLIGYKSE